MSFHVDLKSLNLDPETSARISTKISSVVLSEIAHLDLSEVTTVVGKLAPDLRGIYVIKDLKSLKDLANHEFGK